MVIECACLQRTRQHLISFSHVESNKNINFQLFQCLETTNNELFAARVELRAFRKNQRLSRIIFKLAQSV